MDAPAFPQIELATFETQPPRGGGQAETITVQFNPESLQYTVSNTLKAQGRGRNKKQYVDKTEAKLSMTLVFDTTHNGQDVRVQTDKMAKLLRPVAQGNKQVPPNVEFGWGSYSFRGMVEQYKETLDFFAANGVPLRASVEVTLTSQDVQFDSASDDSAGVDGQNATDTPVVPAAAGAGGGGGPAGLANQLGDPRAARAIAAANGSASLRFGGEAGLAIDAGIELQGEAAFSVGAGAGLGLGVGAGAGLSAGAGLDVGLAGGIGASAGFGGSAGLSVDAGASASFGADLGAAAGNAFADLRAVTPSPPSLPDAAGVFSASAGIDIGAGAGAQVGIGGAAQAGGGGGLTADVGAEADLNAMIRFS